MLPRHSTMTSRPAFPSDCRFLLRHTLTRIHKFLPPYRPRCAHTIWFTGRLQRQSESHRLRQTTSTTSPRTTSATTSHARTFLHKGYHLFLHRHQRPRKVRLPETRPQARRLSRRLHPASTPTMSPAPVSSSPRLGPRLLHLSPRLLYTLFFCFRIAKSADASRPFHPHHAPRAGAPAPAFLSVRLFFTLVSFTGFVLNRSAKVSAARGGTTLWPSRAHVHVPQARLPCIPASCVYRYVG